MSQSLILKLILQVTKIVNRSIQITINCNLPTALNNLIPLLEMQSCHSQLVNLEKIFWCENLKSLTIFERCCLSFCVQHRKTPDICKQYGIQLGIAVLSFQTSFTSPCGGVGVPESTEPESFQDVSQSTLNQSGEHSCYDLPQQVLQPHTAHYPTVGLVSLLSLVLSGSVRILEEEGVHKKLGGGTNRRLNLAKEIFHTLRHHAQIISWGQSGQDTLLRSCLSIWL